MDNPLYDHELDAFPTAPPVGAADTESVAFIPDRDEGDPAPVAERGRFATWVAGLSLPEMFGLCLSFGVLASSPAVLALRPRRSEVGVLLVLFLATPLLIAIRHVNRRCPTIAEGAAGKGEEKVKVAGGLARRGETDEAIAAGSRVEIVTGKGNDLRIVIGPTRDAMDLSQALLHLLLWLFICGAMPWAFRDVQRHRDDSIRRAEARRLDAAIVSPVGAERAKQIEMAVQHEGRFPYPEIFAFLVSLLLITPPFAFLIAAGSLFTLVIEEEIVLRGDWLAVRARPIAFRKAVMYPVAALRNLRYTTILNAMGREGRRARKACGYWAGSMWYRPVIAVDAGETTLYFGNKLSEADAKRLIAAIRRHHAIPCDNQDDLWVYLGLG